MNYLTVLAVLAVLSAHPVAASLEDRPLDLERAGPERSSGGSPGALRLAQGLDQIQNQGGLDKISNDQKLDKSGIQQQFDRGNLDQRSDETGLDASGIQGPNVDQAGQAVPASPILLPQNSVDAAPAVSAPSAAASVIENNEEGRATGLPPGDIKNPYYIPETN